MATVAISVPPDTYVQPVHSHMWAQAACAASEALSVVNQYCIHLAATNIYLDIPTVNSKGVQDSALKMKSKHNTNSFKFAV